MNHSSLSAFGSAAHGSRISPPLHSPEHASLIDGARQRSRSFGLREIDEPDFSPLANNMIQLALEENRLLYQHATPVMETLYHQIANTHSMVLLTARSGMVLHSLGDADFLEKASQVALRPGSDWSEQSKGTNAIGTALALEVPLVVHGDQHFLQANNFLTCSCTPIFDPHGKMVGALDVTGDQRNYHQHTMALVRMSAQMIENHMFADVFPNELLVRFHSRPEFLGTLVEGIAAFSPDGRFLTANRSAQFQLGLSQNALGAHTFSSLFGCAVSQLLDRMRHAGGRPISLCLHNGVTVCCLSEFNPRRPTVLAPAASEALPREPAAALPAASKLTGARESLSSLRYLDTGDPQVAAVIQKLTLVRGRDIPIMILGETGSGKDLLAQAIHNDSPRAHKPFVSVNCASIPETLIESELFGYEEGAFTGAKRKGSIGKIQMAHGGTLFLDEIGDMPKHLQARLLRVLQERKVSPLGADREVEVDVSVVCATHRNLKDMIAKNEFREDLYYRLNGLVVRLPALRERQDLEVVIRKILASVSQSAVPIGISGEVMQLFQHFPWPGNFRQLFNLLRTAVVMAHGCEAITLQHLPDDFLEEVRSIGMPALTPEQAARAPLMPLLPLCSEAALAPASAKLDQLSLDAITQALRSHGGNVSAAAKALGVSRNTIYRKKSQLPDDLWN